MCCRCSTAGPGGACLARRSSSLPSRRLFDPLHSSPARTTPCHSRCYPVPRRAAPAVLFLPHLHLWWRTASPQLRATLVMLLRDLPPELPLLLLATAERPHQQLDRDLRAADLFRGPDHVLALEQPRQQQRRDVLKVRADVPRQPALMSSRSYTRACKHQRVHALHFYR